MTTLNLMITTVQPKINDEHWNVAFQPYTLAYLKNWPTESVWQTYYHVYANQEQSNTADEPYKLYQLYLQTIIAEW